MWCSWTLPCPGSTAWKALARATTEFSAVKVFILSMHANEEYAMETHRAGACGYLLKEGAVAELELARRAVLLTNYVSGSGHAKIKFLTNDDVHRLIP